jgi:5-formyltetrahydrofolate cyclo-ligase
MHFSINEVPFMQSKFACFSTAIIFPSSLGSITTFLSQPTNQRRQPRQFSSHQSVQLVNTQHIYTKYQTVNSRQYIGVPRNYEFVEEKMSNEDINILRERKKDLRKEVRARIKESYPPNETDKLVTQSNLVFSRLYSLPQYQSAKSVGFFLSMPSGEIQTREAIRRIVQDGKVLFVPRVGLDFEKCDMDLVKAVISDGDRSSDEEGQMFYDKWPKNKWNIPEPPIKSDDCNESTSLIAQPGDIDFLIVPGLAFDSNGHRLGQGKGYYDRFISKMRSHRDDNQNGSEDHKPLLVGVCLEEQYLATDGFGGIPITNHDYIMDMVITPTKTLTVGKSSFTKTGQISLD